MDELGFVLIAVIAVGVIGFEWGASVNQDLILEDCKVLDEFHHDGTVYNCEVIEKESDK